MLKTIIKFLFGNKVESLLKKSQGIMSVFSNTVDQLTHVNDEIKKHHDLKAELVAALEKEKAVLMGQHENNSKTINKITDFLK